jgi:glycosyltransferase involved in cell wall biosynthesis
VSVGGTDEGVQALRRQAQSLGVGESATFLPAVPPRDVPLYHRVADVLVTCRAKGLNTPLKIYQYLRSGRPIVATDIVAHTQVLSADVAELVPPTPEGIAAGLVRVLRDPARGSRLAENASALQRSRYSEDAYFRTLADFLERVRASRPGRPRAA